MAEERREDLLRKELTMDERIGVRTALDMQIDRGEKVSKNKNIPSSVREHFKRSVRVLKSAREKLKKFL